MNTSHYYKILGISENATLRDIKEAFRQKAKAYHPDINKDEGANEHFLDINEAYTYLTDMHSRGPGAPVDKPSMDEYYRQWMERERQKARARASQRAQMRFEEFRKSEVYKTTSMLSHMVDYFLMLLGLFIIIAGGLGFYSTGLYITEDDQEVLNVSGIIAGIVITLTGTLFIILSWSNIKEYRKKITK